MEREGQRGGTRHFSLLARTCWNEACMEHGLIGYRLHSTSVWSSGYQDWCSTILGNKRKVKFKAVEDKVVLQKSPPPPPTDQVTGETFIYLKARSGDAVLQKNKSWPNLYWSTSPWQYFSRNIKPSDKEIGSGLPRNGFLSAFHVPRDESNIWLLQLSTKRTDSDIV